MCSWSRGNANRLTCPTPFPLLPLPVAYDSPDGAAERGSAAGGAGWRPKPAGRTGRGRFNENNARPAPARVLPLGLGGWVCEKLEPTSRRLRQKRVPSCARTEAPARARATLYSRGVKLFSKKFKKVQKCLKKFKSKVQKSSKMFEKVQIQSSKMF